jgi:uncharacterized membrane protein YgcG
MQFAVYLGPTDDDPRAIAERLFAEGSEPDVLVLVATTARRVEILTAPDIRQRVTDDACTRAIELMRPHLRRRRWDRALTTGIEHLASAAGPGHRTPGDPEIPDLFDET